MTVSPAGIALIKSRESCRLESYLCPAGIPTIGYGHTGPEVHVGQKITQTEADALLEADLARFDGAVSRTCPTATLEQHSAMVCLAYNIGPAAFAASSVARLHNAGRYAEAAQAFALWNKGGGKVLPGLVSRRAQEAALYLSDTQEPPAAAIAEGEKPLTRSRTQAGQAIAAASIAGGTGLQSIHDHAAEFQQVQDTLQSIAPYYQGAVIALVVVALVGLAWGMYARWEDRDAGRN